MSNKFAQRARKPNYTREETEALLDQLIVYGHFLFNKTQPVNNQQKADVWANIAMQVNSVPNSAGRTIDELKHRWQDMAQRARAVLRKSQSQSTNDTSKSLLIKPVPFLHKILKILGESNKDLGQRPDESHLASLDSTYSSDSSCTNEVKHGGIKEENDDHNAIDLSQSNGPNSQIRSLLKRSFYEATNSTPKPNIPAMLSLSEKFKGELNNSSSLPPMADHQSSTLIYLDHDQEIQDKIENKRRKIKHSSNEKQFLEQDQNNSLTHSRHPHPEVSRSMVLDPESQLIMEVEESGGDERSQSSSHSASNVSTFEEDDNRYEDVCHENRPTSHLRQQLLQNQKFSLHPIIPIANTNMQMYGNRTIPGPPPLRLHNFPRPLYHHPSGQQPIVQNHSHPLISNYQLETLPKSELERQCIISQIRMQDQQTRYLEVKEKKIQLEIDVLKGKGCSCKNNNHPLSNTETNVAEDATPIPSSSFPPPPTSSPPCHLSISNVTSCQIEDFETSLQKEQHQSFKSKLEEGEGKVLSPSSQKSTDHHKPLRLECASENGIGEHEDEENGKGKDGAVGNKNSDQRNGNGESESPNSDNENNNCEGSDDDEALPVCFDSNSTKNYETKDENVENKKASEEESKNEDWVKALQENVG